MSVKYFIKNDHLLAGITMKNPLFKENNNMALHICESTEDIIQNREKLAVLLQCDLKQFVCANQTHSANFHKVTRHDVGRGAYLAQQAIPNTDALYTYESDILLTSFTADCVPVIFYGEEDHIVGIVHSGWQGTIQEITLKLLLHLKDNEKCNISNFKVIIGPALSQRRFEVDSDVYEKFAALGYAEEYIYLNEETKKYHIDNQLTVKKQCELAGIPSENIKIDTSCTFESEDCFSFRKNKSDGRHLSFIIQKESN